MANVIKVHTLTHNLQNDFLVGFYLDTLTALRSAFEGGNPDEENPYTPKTKIDIPQQAIRCIRLSGDELTVIVGLAGGVVKLYSVEKIFSVSFKFSPFF